VVKWEEPRAYSFVLADNRCGGGERNYFGRMRVFVEDGETLEYGALDETAEQFSGPPSDVPTLADLLARVEEARNATEPEVTVVTDPADGHPVELFIDWAPDAMDDEECYVISEYALAPPSPSRPPGEERWEEPEHYVFEFEASCGLRVLHGRFRAFVADGTTYRFEPLDEAAAAFPLSPADLPTLGEMLDRAHEASLSEQSTVELVTDPLDGRPVRIEIDWIRTAIDDEECYEILAYEELDPSTVPSASP
jgi:hypothetical protein